MGGEARSAIFFLTHTFMYSGVHSTSSVLVLVPGSTQNRQLVCQYSICKTSPIDLHLALQSWADKQDSFLNGCIYELLRCPKAGCKKIIFIVAQVWEKYIILIPSTAGRSIMPISLLRSDHHVAQYHHCFLCKSDFPIAFRFACIIMSFFSIPGNQYLAGDTRGASR